MGWAWPWLPKRFCERGCSSAWVKVRKGLCLRSALQWCAVGLRGGVELSEKEYALLILLIRLLIIISHLCRAHHLTKTSVLIAL